MKLSIASCLLATLLLPVVASAAPSPVKERVASLTAVLNSSASQKDKADACRELAQIGTKEAVAPLAALLGDERLSHMARYGLEPIPDAAVDKALREALGNLSGRCLVGVIGSVGVRRDAKAVKPLTALLRHSDPDVAQAAARALGQIGTTAAAAAIQEALPNTPAANRAAFCEGWLRCAEKLSADGRDKKAVAIYDQLRAVATPLQARAAGWRGAILARGKDAPALLREAIRHNDLLVFDAGIRAALELRHPKATSTLTDALPSLAADRQIVLIGALAKRGDAAALPALLSTARNCPTPVRVAAIRALPEIIAGFQGPAAAVEGPAQAAQVSECLPLLTDLVTDPTPEVAKAARESLAALPGAQVDGTVLSLLKSTDNSRRLLALDLVSRRRMTSAIPDLFKAAEAPEPEFRRAAVKKVGELGSPADVPSLLAVLDRAKTTEDLDAAEQSLSAVSLKAGNADAATEPVRAHLARAATGQKCALLRVLAAVGGTKALASVRDAVKDPNAEVHAAAIRALGGWNGPEAAPLLLELARSTTDPTDKMLCLRGYLNFAAQSDQSADQRLAMCREAAALVEREPEKKLLLGTLGQVNAPGSLALIEKYLDDPALKEEAATAVLNVAEKLLQRKNADQSAKLVAPLEKVAQVTGNPDLAKRAKTLIERAQQAR